MLAQKDVLINVNDFFTLFLKQRNTTGSYQNGKYYFHFRVPNMAAHKLNMNKLIACDHCLSRPSYADRVACIRSRKCNCHFSG